MLRYISPGLARWLALAHVAGLLGLAAALVMAASVTTDYSPIASTVSQLMTGRSPSKLYMRAGLIIYGASLLPLAIAGHRLHRPGRPVGVVTAFLIVTGISIILAAIFPEARNGQALANVPGTVHYVATRAGGASILLAIGLEVRAIGRSREGEIFLPMSIVVLALGPTLGLLRLGKPCTLDGIIDEGCGRLRPRYRRMLAVAGVPS